MHLMAVAALFLVSVVAAIAAPIALAIFIRKRYKASWKVWAVGLGMFLVSLLRFVILYPLAFLLDWLFPGSLAVQLGVLVLFCLAAGLCEEPLRYLAFRYFLKKERRYEDGLMYGAGHGGVESMLTGLIISLTVINLISYQFVDFSSMLNESQMADLNSAINYYKDLPFYMPLLGGFERLLALTFHVAMSVLVLQCFRKGTKAYLWLAILLHFLFNFTAAVVLLVFGAVPAELALLAFSMVSVLIIYKYGTGRNG